MKRCPSCGESYDDGVKFCDGDGTPLVAEFTPAEGRRARWGALGVGLALGVAACVAAFVLYRVATREGDGVAANSRPSTAVSGTPTAPARPAAVEPAPAPTVSPEATPSLSPSPVPTQLPPRREEDGLDTLSDSPATTGGPGARADARVIFHLTDGAVVEAEDAWKAPGGAWYRRGGVLEWLDRSRIRSVERRAAPTPAPQAPQGSSR